MFEFTESTVTLQPFECYITPAPESQMAQMPRRMSIPSPSQISTATSLPMIEANELLWQIVGNTLVVATGGQPVNVYTINGVLLHSFAAGEDCVSINLTNGCYILQSGNAVQKIVF